MEIFPISRKLEKVGEESGVKKGRYSIGSAFVKYFQLGGWR
jgi:hypothetical protein